MARIIIDIGTLGNPATGDTLRTAMTKINTNFEELFIGNASDGQITTTVTNGDISIQPNGTGIVEVDALSVNSDNITSLTTNSSVTITGNGTGGVDIEGISVNGTTISSSDSSTININENLIVDGTGDFSGTLSVTGASTLTGGATIDGVSITDNTISTGSSNANLELTASGTGSVSIDGIQISGTEISSSDSTQITIKENLHVTGNITGTIDADNSTVSNLEVDNFKAASIVTEAEGIGSNDNDTTLPTSAAVKDYVDARDIGDLSVTGSTISAPSNADLTLTTSGTGSVSIDGIQISGTEISSSDSTQITIKENLHVTGNISGTITGTVTGTIDADSSTISNLEVDNFKASAIITVAESLASNDSDTALVTAGAVIDYVDAQDANIASDTLTFTNKTIDANATGNNISNIDIGNMTAAVVVTESEGIGSNDNDTTIPTSAAVKDYVDNNAGGTTGDLAITGSTISTPSNADLTLSPGGTGSVQTPGVTITDNKITSNRSNDNLELNASGTGTIVLENLKVGTGATVTTILDEDNMSSDSATALATQQSIKAYVDSQAGTGGMTFSGNTMSTSSNADIEITPGGTGAVVLGDAIRIRDNHLEGTRSNEDVIIDPAGTGGIIAQGPVTFNAGYIEKINTLTSSSTITVNCATASVHKVTLATSTEFNIANLPTGGTVTLIITQDGTGSRTATFGTDGSSAVKFPSNSSTLSTGAADIDVVTIINDGTNFLGNIAKDYRSS